MSSADNQGAGRQVTNPFLDQAEVSAPAAPRKARPSPRIISAGGVEMARAHAVGICARASSYVQPINTARVVLNVESDTRRVPTERRLPPGRATSRARTAKRPSTSLPTGARALAAVPRRTHAASRVQYILQNLSVRSRVGRLLIGVACLGLAILCLIPLRGRSRGKAPTVVVTRRASVAVVEPGPATAAVPPADEEPSPPPPLPPANAASGSTTEVAAPKLRLEKRGAAARRGDSLAPTSSAASATRSTYVPPFELPSEKSR